MNENKVQCIVLQKLLFIFTIFCRAFIIIPLYHKYKFEQRTELRITRARFQYNCENKVENRGGKSLVFSQLKMLSLVQKYLYQ